MSGFQVSMLLTAAAFSLVSMIVVFLVALFSLTLFLKPKPSILRLAIGFAISWAAVSVYLPFKSVSYYTQNSGEMYLAELIISIIALFAITKLFPIRATTPSEAVFAVADSKKCPFCAEIIKKEAILCRFCGKELPQVAPDPVAEAPAEISKCQSFLENLGYQITRDGNKFSISHRDQAGVDYVYSPEDLKKWAKSAASRHDVEFNDA